MLGRELHAALERLVRRDGQAEGAQRGEAAVAAEAVEDGIVHAAHRHWWSAARGAVNHLRASNVAIGSEARRADELLKLASLGPKRPKGGGLTSKFLSGGRRLPSLAIRLSE